MSLPLLLGVVTALISRQSDPYVRVLVNDVIEARTEVVNNSRLNLLSKGVKILMLLVRP